MQSMTSDYVKSTGSPQPYLKRIAEAGFTHVHWCHHWDTDFIYCDSEIQQIKKWFADYSLKLNDLHASAGREKCWVSSEEYERLAGVELLKNRIEMAAMLESDVIIIHPSNTPHERKPREKHRDSLLRSLGELESFTIKAGVRLALENVMTDPYIINQGLDNFGTDFIGICYDSGHGNFLKGSGLDWLESYRDRLISLHLHDNDGFTDQHKIPFTGTVDWERLTSIIAASPYNKAINQECAVRNPTLQTELDFLGSSLIAGEKIKEMINRKKDKP